MLLRFRYILFAVFAALFLIGCQSLDVDRCLNVDSASAAPFEITTLEFGQAVLFDDSLLSLAAKGNKQRAMQTEALFHQHCPSLRVDEIPKSVQHNYVCTVMGEVDEKIVIGSHYDKVRRGLGIADNWSGVVLNVHLLAYFAESKPYYTLEFVAFGEEEPGMFGSKQYLLAHNQSPTIAMINIDTLGLGPIVVDKRSDESLNCLATNIAGELGIDVEFSNWDDITGDWEPFKQQGIPVLNLSSINRKTIHRIHNQRDREGNVDPRLMHEALQIFIAVIENINQVKK